LRVPKWETLSLIQLGNMPELILGTVLPEVAKNFGQYAFVSAREIEHGRFRALFAGSFGLRCRMVEFVQEHLAISIQILS
jgi:hypothetical protein